MTREKFSELSMLRQNLKGMATEEACRRAKPSLLKKLGKVYDGLLGAIRKRDVSHILTCNQEFHFAIYEASQYRILLPIIKSLWLQAGPFLYFSLSGPSVQWNTPYHKEAMIAIAAGDFAASRKVNQNEIRATADYLLNNMTFRF